MRPLFALLTLLLLAGCLSSNLLEQDAFKAYVNRDLTIQRQTAYLYRREYMTNVWYGRWVEVYTIGETARMDAPSIALPVGTPLRIKRIERRSLIDAGIEIIAFGTLRRPDTGEEVQFIYELTAGLGSELRRAPWEDESTPALRPTPGK